MRGRRPKPEAVREAQGNPGKRKQRKAPTAPASIRAIQPAFEINAGELALFQKLASELSSLHLLRPSDSAAFTRYCVLLAKFQTANENLKGQELVVTTESAHVTMQRINPWLKLMMALDKRLSDIEDRFGLNPMARQRLMLALAQGVGTAARDGELPLEATAPARPEAPVSSPVGALVTRH